MPSKTIRINLNFPEHLLKRVDEYAYNMGISRTAAVCVLVSTQFQQDNAIQSITKACDLINQQERGSEEQQKEKE